MRHSLIKEIKKTSDITNVIVLTHNIDFIFLQSIVLPSLKKIGHPKLTVFADARCAEESFASQFKILDSIGVRYRVVPVPMEPGFRFHPKAILLTGPEKAILFVGSGNLTFGGWYENAEIWARIASDADGTAQLSAFKLFLEEVVKLVPVSYAVQNEIEEAFDANTKEWAAGLAEPAGMIGKAGRGEPLATQILDSLEGRQVRRLWVCAPFFDEDAEALQELVEMLGGVETTVLLQKGRSGLRRSAAVSLPKNVSLVPVNFYHENKDGDRRESYIHAKFFSIDHGDSVSTFLGSANCSHAALTIPGRSGNAELLAIQRMSHDEFQKLFLDEFEYIEGDPELSDQTVELEDAFDGYGRVQVLAARYEPSDLKIGYKCSKEIRLIKCFVNDAEVDFKKIGGNELLTRFEGLPKYVVLDGSSPGGVVHSNRCWVDNEHELRLTARGRSLSHVICSRVVREYWDLGAWSDVLDVFCKHLEYVPIVGAYKVGGAGGKGKDKTFTYSEEDVFSSGYGLSSLKLSVQPFGRDDFGVTNLQQLLLRWFGYRTTEDDLSDEIPFEDNDDNGEETVDRPEPLLPKKPEKEPKKDVEKEQKKAKKFTEKVADIMCSKDYLENRPLELLSSDLKLVSVLLLTGLRNRWLTQDKFFNITHRIWLNLFFTSNIDRSTGWLELRACSEDPLDDPIERMKSVELSTALAIWALAFPFDFSTSDKAIFTMSCILSVARLPWLWHGGSCDEIAHELQKDSLQKVYLDKITNDSIEIFKKRWRLLIRFGHSIRKFEDGIRGRKPVDFKDLIKQDYVPEGELLWQGKSGYCISSKDCKRSQYYMAKVLSLQKDSKETEISPDFLTPVRALISENVIPDTEYFNDNHRRYIKELVSEIRKGLGSNRDH